MTLRWRSRLRHLRRIVFYGLALLLILSASLVGLVSQLLPVLERNPERVAAWISDQAGRPVGFERMQVAWTRRGPLLTLEQLHIGDPGERLRVDRAGLLVAIYSGLLPGRPLTELRLDGLALTLERDESGDWTLQGLGQSEGSEDPLAALRGLGELQIRDAALTVRLAGRDEELSLPRLDARLRADESRLRIGVAAWSRPDRPPLSVVVDMDRRDGDGRVWLGGEDIEASALAVLTGLVGIEPLAGSGAFQLWVDLRQRQPVRARLEADMTGLVFRGRQPIAPEGADGGAGAGIEPRLAIERWQASVRWRRTDDGGWRLEAPELRWLDGSGQARLDGLLAGAGERGGLEVPSLDIAPWLSLLAVSDRVEPALRRWLYLASPHGRIVDLELAGGPGRGLRGHARLESLGWLPALDQPGLQGLAGSLRLDDQALELEIDQAGTLRLDWPHGFAEPALFQASGHLRAWRQDEGYVIQTDALRIGGEDFGLLAALRFDAADPARPRLDASAEVDAGPAIALRRFWLRHSMSPKTIAWLDRALVGGQLAGGRIVFGGELADWPFREDQGRFLARTRFEDVPLLFDSRWPAAERFNAEIEFTGRGLELTGEGVLARNAVDRVQARIGDYREPVLALELDAHGAGVDLLALLRNSPLMDSQGDHLRALRLGGQARARLSLTQPLRPDLGEVQLRGTIDLSDAPLAHGDWGIDFGRADGRIRFGETGLSADELLVRLNDDSGSFSLAVGAGFVSDPALAAEASLRGRFPAAPLLERAPELDWLQPYLSGRADWTVTVKAPRSEPGVPAPPASLRVESDLGGIAIGLPAPLRKGPDGALPLRVTTSLPVAGQAISVDLGALMAIRGRVGEDGKLDATIGFGGQAGGEHGGGGLRVVGQVPVLDAAGWAGFAAGGSEQGLLHSVDLQAGELDLLDRAFIDTRVKLDVLDDQVALELDGPEIAGRMTFPDDRSQSVAGDFERLYWPSGRLASVAGGDPDPTAVPALRLRIDDLRFGEARLGRAELDTYPTPEGLHVERLSTDSPMLTLAASGDWTRIDDRSRSRFAIEFTSGNLGRMLDALGFAGLVDGGKTRSTIVASWAGSPAAFGLEKVDGELALSVGQGRFLEVDPGAGRLLGLISLAEIPRRLLLDFRDLFSEGLQFSQIEGNFTLAQGVASTDDLKINSSAAQIKIRGRTLLDKQVYDQTIEVLPKTSSMFPALGALAGGPAGIVLGALAQAILKSPMQQMGRTVFRVTGPWIDPEVVVLERGDKSGDNEPGPVEPPARSD